MSLERQSQVFDVRIGVAVVGAPRKYPPCVEVQVMLPCKADRTVRLMRRPHDIVHQRVSGPFSLRNDP